MIFIIYWKAPQSFIVNFKLAHSPPSPFPLFFKLLHPSPLIFILTELLLCFLILWLLFSLYNKLTKDNNYKSTKA